jgi:hypothetical protein
MPTKYPLGHLDDRYIEDKLEWLAEQKATKQADTALQRQQERAGEAEAALNRKPSRKVDDLSAKGAALYPDFQEEVVETGMRGIGIFSNRPSRLRLKPKTARKSFTNLSQDAKEAKRVARLSVTSR